MSGVQRDSLRASRVTSPGRSCDLGVSHTRHCCGCGTQDPSQLPKPREGFPQSFQTFKQLLGKPEIHLKASQNSGPEALKTYSQPGHRQCLSKQLQLLEQLRSPRSSGSAWGSSPATPWLCPKAISAVPHRAGRCCLAAQVRWHRCFSHRHFGVHSPINDRIHPSPITHSTRLRD